MRHLPVFFDIAERTCLVVGDGEAAARKIVLLRRAGGRVRVSSPQRALASARGAAADRLPDVFDDCALVVSATGDRAVDAVVSREAKRRGIPVNVVDAPALCTFQIPAIVDRDPVLVAISTGGAAPVLARWIRRRIERALPAALDRLGRFAARWRSALRRAGASRQVWEDAFDGPAAEFALQGRDDEADRAMRALLAADRPATGVVDLVGAGPGDPELLTLKAHRLLQSADAIVYDRLIPEAVLNLARRDADLVYAGKAPGAHAMPQNEINDLLVALGSEGKRVVRLKGGDPFVFGRGGEEMLAVEAAGIPCHVVPGITAATGCAAAAGVPLTHRGVARSCVFVTGHGGAEDWAALARGDRTIVVHMGRSALPDVAGRLLRRGLRAGTPVTVIENGTAEDQRVVTGTLATIAGKARRLTGPALAIIGETAAFARSPARPERLAA